MNIADELEKASREIQNRIAARMHEEIRPIVEAKAKAIVDEEVAAFAVNLSRWVNVRTFGDTLRIEICKKDPA